MSRPTDSAYRGAFQNLPAEFKEQIEIIYRDLAEERDDYGKPVYNENALPVMARFNPDPAADLTPEQGGLRATNQAKVYLPIASQPLLFFDSFNEPGSLSPIRWIIESGVSPVLADGIASYEPAHYGYASAIMEPEVAWSMRVRFRWSLPITFPSEVLFGMVDNPAIGGNCILVWAQGPLGGQIFVRRDYGGPVESESFNFELDGDWHEIILERSETELVVWLDDIIIWRYNGPALPIVPFYPLMGGVSPSASETYQFDYVICSKEKDDTNPIRIQDQIEAREKRWSIIQQPHLTHLQQELYVQEVLDG